MERLRATSSLWEEVDEVLLGMDNDSWVLHSDDRQASLAVGSLDVELEGKTRPISTVRSIGVASQLGRKFIKHHGCRSFGNELT